LIYDEKDSFWVQNLWIPLFNHSSDNLFSSKFKWDLYHVLYRNAQSIQDLLFASFLCGHQDIRLGDVKPKAKTMSLEQITRYSYSSKKIWIEEDCTIHSSWIVANELYYMLGKKKQITGGKKQIYSEICKACEEMACTKG